MLSVKEVLSAIDLAELYAETLLKAKCEASEKIYLQIFSIVGQFCNPSLPMPTPNAQNKFISTCVMWSQAIANKRRERKHGLSELHHVIAQAYSKHQQYANARNHMLFADHPEDFAKLLHKMRENGGSKSSECEMFCVLPCLQVKLFEELVQVYKPHLDVDPMFHNYLGQIGHIFFGIQSSKNKADSFGGLFGNILKGVLGEKKDEELYFSDSDFESTANIIRTETEEAYETAEESDGGDMRDSKEQVKQNAVESFDDLD
uniref:VPS9 domain-containing protein n=1 Tax=Angiostrongylus cantonensis TaxID=6313 RepID=A0A0K0DGC9_ANGCA